MTPKRKQYVPKSMKLIATHNREVKKDGRTNNSLIYYQVKIS
jgi:hypothetical protein